jgi:hypothetical protein
LKSSTGFQSQSVAERAISRNAGQNSAWAAPFAIASHRSDTNQTARREPDLTASLTFTAPTPLRGVARYSPLTQWKVLKALKANEICHIDIAF